VNCFGRADDVKLLTHSLNFNVEKKILDGVRSGLTKISLHLTGVCSTEKINAGKTK